jgi:threonyl-tRNA synthetase
MLDLIDTIYRKTFGLNYKVELSTRPKKFLGNKKDWDFSEKILEKTLKKNKISFKINKGDGAFYGPKIDFHIEDSLKRTWQCGTIQLDMQMPQRFDISYIGKDNKEHRPFVFHRTILGSVERFIGILLEHTNGTFPLWLSPIQVRIMSFTDRNKDTVEKILNELKLEIAGLRIDTDTDSITINEKIRNAELQKIPYILVIGDKEEKSKTLAVRSRGGKPEFKVSKEKFIKDIKLELNKFTFC